MVNVSAKFFSSYGIKIDETITINLHDSKILLQETCQREMEMAKNLDAVIRKHYLDSIKDMKRETQSVTHWHTAKVASKERVIMIGGKRSFVPKMVNLCHSIPNVRIHSFRMQHVYHDQICVRFTTIISAWKTLSSQNT